MIQYDGTATINDQFTRIKQNINPSYRDDFIKYGNKFIKKITRERYTLMCNCLTIDSISTIYAAAVKTNNACLFAISTTNPWLYVTRYADSAFYAQVLSVVVRNELHTGDLANTSLFTFRCLSLSGYMDGSTPQIVCVVM